MKLNFDFDYPVKIFTGQFQIKNYLALNYFRFFYFSKFHGFPANIQLQRKGRFTITMITVYTLGIFRYLVQDYSHNFEDSNPLGQTPDIFYGARPPWSIQKRQRSAPLSYCASSDSLT